MAIIQIQNLTFSYGNVNIFENVSINLDSSWKLGLIGRNGRGKTTFLNLLLNKYEYNGIIKSNINFEYFPFNIPNKNESVINIANQICKQVYEWQIKKEFSLLSLNDDILYRSFNNLSSGEQTKVLLAILFLNNNNFLLIDEPTNYLDLEGRIVVSEYLKGKQGFIVVSHDRVFLDSIVDHVLIINKNNIEIQKGNFSSWYQNKQQNDNFEIGVNEKLKKDIKRLSESAKQKELWSNKMEKTKYRTTNSGVSVDRGYIGHKSAKMMKLAKNIEKRQTKIIDDKKQLLKNVEDQEPLKILPLIYHKNQLIDLSKISIQYGQKIVCKEISFTVNAGDRIQIIGKNGSGKSSILKILIGESINYSGELNIGSNLIVSYINQDTSYLRGSLEKFIIENNINQTLFKTILKKLDFNSTDFDKNIDDYSEGMKKKVLIAKSLCESAHVYIWDEPLNYIDIISRIQIEDVILEYKPTLIFVEHDREFSNKIATKVVRID